MHPGFVWYWKRRHGIVDACGGAYAYGWYGPSRRHARRSDRAGWSCGGDRSTDFLFGVGGLGIRRPLRFLAARLELDEGQVSRLAKILDRVKLEREQAAVDLRRVAGDIAEVLEGEALRREGLEAAGERRVEAARRVQEAVARAVTELHALLDERQREELAGLIRSGAIRL
jgi:hypothetical protein